MRKTQKGAIISAGGGEVIGAVVGRASGNTALGALIVATIEGAAWAFVGKLMDKHAEEIKNTVSGAKVYRVGKGIIIEFDKSNLNQSAMANIDKLVTVLSKYPDTNIEVQGHIVVICFRFVSLTY